MTYQVMTTGQRVTFEYHGNGYIFTVNQAAVEGQEKSNNIERGMISNETYIVFEASNSSGIKVTSSSSLQYTYFPPHLLLEFCFNDSLL